MGLFDRFRSPSPEGRHRTEDAPTEPTGYQQTASRLHAFNRYEIKYFVDELKVPELRRELSARMDSDPFSPLGGYPVTSLYYDTPDLRFYWEKIEGLKFRRKLRLRLYGLPEECTDETPVQIEIKQRVNRVTQKRRIALPYGVTQRWLNGREEFECHPTPR
jgi:SPX domain protein involved in polyphosphate accumulation